MKLSDVNTTDILDAVRLGCRTMVTVFNADDGHTPFFGAYVRPEAHLSFSSFASDAHVPGRHLNALLSAEDVAGVRVDEDAVDKHTRAAFRSYGGAVYVPLDRPEIGGSNVNFTPHNIREGFHALYALARYRDSARARSIAEASIDAILQYWDPATDWDYESLERLGVRSPKLPTTFIGGVARSIGPLVKYHRATGYGPALELAVVLKEKAVAEFFTADGGYSVEKFGGHVHSTTCTMSSLAQLADHTSDTILMQRVKAFYDNGLWNLRDGLGWSVEVTDERTRQDKGEANNTGDILETALILGKWGYTDCYHDAERILRGHLLPSQLRDTSFVEQPSNPEGVDGRRDVANRLHGAFGFPAPYGHEPVGLPSVSFNLDIVGGAVGSLCEALMEVARYDATGHRVNLLFDRDTPYIQVESPYTHSHRELRIRLKRPGPLFVRIPPWVDIDRLTKAGAQGPAHHVNGYLMLTRVPVNRVVALQFPLASEDIVLDHGARHIRVRLRGDEVVAMENFGADLTFFDPLE